MTPWRRVCSANSWPRGTDHPRTDRRPAVARHPKYRTSVKKLQEWGTPCCSIPLRPPPTWMVEWAPSPGKRTGRSGPPFLRLSSHSSSISSEWKSGQPTATFIQVRWLPDSWSEEPDDAHPTVTSLRQASTCHLQSRACNQLHLSCSVPAELLSAPGHGTTAGWRTRSRP